MKHSKVPTVAAPSSPMQVFYAHEIDPRSFPPVDLITEFVLELPGRNGEARKLASTPMQSKFKLSLLRRVPMRAITRVLVSWHRLSRAPCTLPH